MKFDFSDYEVNRQVFVMLDITEYMFFFITGKFKFGCVSSRCMFWEKMGFNKFLGVF